MKKSIVLTAVILGLTLSGFGQQKIPKENQIILNETCSSEIKWVPIAEQTQAALVAIEKFIGDNQGHSDSQAEELVKIRKHLTEYGVQFYGVVKNEKKYIYCNFFPAEEFQDASYLINACDGGFWFWQILYDPDTGKLCSLSINGYA